VWITETSWVSAASNRKRFLSGEYLIQVMWFSSATGYFCAMLKRLSDMLPAEVGFIERVDRPEAVLALIEMGCGIGEPVEIAHVTPGRGPMAIFSCGRKVALRREAADELWIRTGDEVRRSQAAELLHAALA
jgi:Fe2+ transport system protein FeoA